MLSRVSKYLKTSVLYANISGKISESTSQTLIREFKKFRISAPTLIAVSINTSSGSYGQAEAIVKTLEDNAKRFDCPIYTFAEDIAAGPGYYILCSGNRVFADPFSLIGGLSISSRSLDLVKLGKDNGIKANIESEGKHKIRVHPFLNVKDEDIAWVQALLEGRAELVRKYVLERRGNRIPREKDKEAMVFGGDVYMGSKAVELGLVDSVTSFREIIQREYYDSKVVEFKELKGSSKGRMFGNGMSLSKEDVENVIDDLPINAVANRLSLKIFI